MTTEARLVTDARPTLNRLFLLALNSGSITAVRAFLRKPGALEAIDSSGRTPLMVVAAKGHLDCCRLLIDEGCNLLATDSAGLDAIAHARRAGRAQVASMLSTYLREDRADSKAQSPAPARGEKEEVASPPARTLPPPPVVLPDDIAEPSASESPTLGRTDTTGVAEENDPGSGWSAVSDMSSGSFPIELAPGEPEEDLQIRLEVTSTELNLTGLPAEVTCSDHNPTAAAPDTEYQIIQFKDDHLQETSASSAAGWGYETGDGWVAEDEDTPVPVQDNLVLIAVAEAQTIFSQHEGAFSDPEWTDVAIHLPSAPTTAEHADPEVFSGSFEAAVLALLAEGSAHGEIASEALQSLMDDAGVVDGAQRSEIIRTLAELGIKLTSQEDPWTRALARVPEAGLAHPSSESAELQAIRENCWSVGRKTALEQELKGIGALSRDEERALLRSAESAKANALVEIVRSEPATALVISCDDLVDTGVLDFSFVSSLELAHGSSAGEEDKDDDDDLPAEVETSQGSLIELPAEYAIGMADLRAVQSRRHGGLLTPSDQRVAVRSLERMAFTPEFLGYLAQELRRHPATCSVATAIERARSATAHVRLKLFRLHLPHINAMTRRIAVDLVPSDDLMQEAALGLLRATELFDPARGYRFWTYAQMHARQRVARGIADQFRLIRLPVHASDDLRRIRNSQELLEREGKIASAEAVAEDLSLPLEKVRRLLRIPEDPFSIDDPGVSAGDLQQALEVTNASDADGPLFEAELRKVVRSLLQDLNEREAQVIRLRFGIDCPTDHTLEEVGRMYGVTRERIRQLEAKALGKMGHPSRARALRALL